MANDFEGVWYQNAAAAWGMRAWREAGAGSTSVRWQLYTLLSFSRGGRIN